jgi:cytochrome b involved in lipid metabolism
MIYSGKVYDVTDYIPFHPGGESIIINQCGKDATSAFNAFHGGSTSIKNQLNNYYIGDLQ